MFFEKLEIAILATKIIREKESCQAPRDKSIGIDGTSSGGSVG